MTITKFSLFLTIYLVSVCICKLLAKKILVDDIETGNKFIEEAGHEGLATFVYRVMPFIPFLNTYMCVENVIEWVIDTFAQPKN